MKKLGIIFGILCLLVGCGEEKKQEPIVKEEPKDTVVSFVGVGDNLIHGSIYREADGFAGEMNDEEYDFKPMYKQVKKDIKKADISFINQETILGGDELGLSGYPAFNSPTSIAEDLNDTGFNLYNLASNHSLDRSSDGIINALQAFDKLEGITYSGISDSEERASQIAVFEREGITFSFLSYTYGTNGIEPMNAYEVSYFDEEKIKNDVAKAKTISDVVIVSAHWGDENTFEPNDMQKKYAQLFADLDVDVVIGTHPHVIQPIEWLEGTNGNQTLVVYSLGNFLGGMLGVDNILSGMISFDFIKDVKTEDIRIENVKWTPLVIHFEGNQNNIVDDRYNYAVYKLEDYSDKLAKKHVLNGYEGQRVDQLLLVEKTKQVINKSFYTEDK
ncbi:poly-gamma-glutamate capsule biosynthesis protein CapA/YwtB (metallophosphatase superfamily) [Breznakia sp. PF5-3]|uniref:CapA family protein n=1 Tax=unclassified Breznakia TaxID=2623764 RepID=UPI002405563D|nr:MULTISPECIES: CapA family protein [unclassified Breznakia]MDL2276646.1 CapA family protein [Breznakia sp. OttesenSCG-928-G09]MDF9825142.1 poly-gamma-glutamate capsule biosynthesis protein CapA/YwtB (metallophosphatase superfamily) [Breznakia sp. PM6-1]MDF9835999.1 poly-gamma-glutamate capsule biosynthesis protein CapA/YwtB (metallophosphatase superfamily) [Breznakia sp. PF5-3]MDF9838097.1 poly-gamma-glutamate capsule biosynthesis protein CapA/YwtB (metallophosphatase superfamily) [Breznakia 